MTDDAGIVDLLTVELSRVNEPVARAPDFYNYLKLLVKWNERINLTGTKDPREIVTRHIVDCLALIPHLPDDATTLIDVGSGAGLPGVVISLLKPELQVTMVESNRKKCAFLHTVKRECRLDAATVDGRRIEDVQGDGVVFDVAVSRATWSLEQWLERGEVLIRPGGVVLGMEARRQIELPETAVRHEYTPAEASTDARSIIVLRRSPQH